MIKCNGKSVEHKKLLEIDTVTVPINLLSKLFRLAANYYASDY